MAHPSNSNSAYTVACQFVKQYYSLMNQDASLLHNLYHNDAVMIRGVEGERDIPTLNGPSEIASFLQKRDLKGNKVIITNLDAQPSLPGSFLVVCTGELYGKGDTHQMFSQTFVLVKSEDTFFILNDVFRFLRVRGDEVPEEFCNGESAIAPEVDNNPEEEREAAKTQELASPVPSRVPEAKPAVSGSPKKSSWANLAATDGEKWGNQMTADKGAVASPVSVLSPKGSKKIDIKKNVEGCVVLVQPVPQDVDYNFIRQFFVKHGPVQFVSHDTKRHIALVEFVSPKTAEKVVSMGTIQISGIACKVSLDNSGFHPKSQKSGSEKKKKNTSTGKAKQ